MAVRFEHVQRDVVYFCTFTCTKWLNLFSITNFYDEIYRWFNRLTAHQHQIIGFVIMPNHLHLMLRIGDMDYSINTVLANGKRFCAYEIVKRLESMKEYDILSILREKVTAAERNRKKKHRVFEVSSDIKPCYTETFLLQKLEYIHDNPVVKKWRLAETAEEYEHSSARFYRQGLNHPNVVLTHFEDLSL